MALMEQTAFAAFPDEALSAGLALDVTPAFSRNAESRAAVFLFGAECWPLSTVRHRWSPELTATSIVPRNVLASHLDRWFGAMTCTAVASLPGDIPQIWVVPLATRPTELVGDFVALTRVEMPPVPSPAERALAAVADVQAWLGVGRDEVAQLAGYSPRSIKNWREGMDPYPATVRRLRDIHALVGSLTRRLGLEGARLWLADSAAGGRARRDLLGEGQGLSTLVSEASGILFEQPAGPTVHDTDFEEEAGPETPPRPELFTGPVRRSPRRP